MPSYRRYAFAEGHIVLDSCIRTAGVRKIYNTRGTPLVALDGVDLNIGSGEFTSIMGPSGCGKSTLLHILGGLDRPTEGEVYLRGERVDGLSESQWACRRRGEIGYVFQFFNLIVNLTAADNIELPALIHGASSRDARQRRIELMEALGIADRAHAVPAELSGGEQQRVALARALVNEPEVLLADEPTGNLDSASAEDVLDVLRAFSDAGQTILMVTHDPQVARAGHRVVHMQDGRIVRDEVLVAADKAGAAHSPTGG
jgi:putative ABC transport system ATP-binding protein